MTLTARQSRLAGAALIMMGTFVASRLTGLLRDVAVSYQFGTGRELDAYLAAIQITDFVFQVTAGGAVASAFIPVFAGYVARGEMDAGWRLVSTLLNLAVVVLTPLIALLLVFAPAVVRAMAPAFEPEYQALAGELARVLLVAPLFFTLGCFVTSVLNSHQRFLLAALAPTSYNLGITAGALLFAPRLGIHGLALGAALGSLLFLLVQVPGLFQVGLRYRPLLDLRHPGVREVGRLMAPRTLGLGIVQVNFLVTLYLVSGVPGGRAALNWAWLLTMLPLGVFAMAISSAVFPSLAAQSARAELADLRRTIATSLRFILYLTIPATVGLVALGDEVVRVLFERGRFTASSTAMTAHALQLYALGLVGMAAVEIVTRAFYACHDTRTPVAVAGGALLLNVALAVALVGPLSFGGLALATALASLAEAGALLALAERRLPGLLDRALAASAGRSALAAALMGLVVLALRTALAGPLSVAPPAERALLLLGVIGLSAAAYLAASLLLRSEEVGQLRSALAR